MIALIAAYAKNRVIGSKGRLPWYIAGDMIRFQELTSGNILIMGRRTFEEIGKPLPGRMTYLVSATRKEEAPNCKTVTGLSEAIDTAYQDMTGGSENKNGKKDIFICGGAALYREAIPLVDKMFLTIIEREYEGDVFFPEFDTDAFIKTLDESHTEDIPYRYVIYEKKKG